MLASSVPSRPAVLGTSVAGARRGARAFGRLRRLQPGQAARGLRAGSRAAEQRLLGGGDPPLHFGSHRRVQQPQRRVGPDGAHGGLGREQNVEAVVGVHLGRSQPGVRPGGLAGEPERQRRPQSTVAAASGALITRRIRRSSQACTASSSSRDNAEAGKPQTASASQLRSGSAAQRHPARPRWRPPAPAPPGPRTRGSPGWPIAPGATRPSASPAPIVAALGTASTYISSAAADPAAAPLPPRRR